VLDQAGAEPGRLDPDGAGHDLVGRVALAQPGDVVDAVEERHHQAVAEGLGRDGLDRLGELGRLDGDEAHVHRVVEPGRGLDRHPGVAQGRAAQLQAVGGQVGGGGRRSKAGDLVAPAGKQGRDQPADPARPQDRHPGRRQGLTLLGHGWRAASQG
jgi:hypothetical protein